MELAFVIWAVGTLPAFASGLSFITSMLGMVGGVGWGILSILSNVEQGKDQEQAIALTPIFSKVFRYSLVIWFICMLIPDKTTSYQMLAAYGVQKVVENPKAQQLAGDGVDVLSALMKKAKIELEKSTGSE